MRQGKDSQRGVFPSFVKGERRDLVIDVHAIVDWLVRFFMISFEESQSFRLPGLPLDNRERVGVKYLLDIVITLGYWIIAINKESPVLWYWIKARLLSITNSRIS